MTVQAPQRAWKASCSFCGASVEFQSAASPMAVCSYCRSTLVRDGEMLRRIGESATLFDDHSPLGLGARGRYQGEPFTLVGRIQLAYLDSDGDAGRWSEWHVLFDNGRSACLSEDNGIYVLSFALPAPEQPLPDLLAASLGERFVLAGREWVLSSRVQAKVHAAQGELAGVPDFKRLYPVVELRNPQGEVLSVEPHARPSQMALGRAIELQDLALVGLPREGQPAEAAIQGRGFACPNCGSALAPTLDSTQSIVCGSCHSVVDIRGGLGADLTFYKQDNALEPLIPLGSTAALIVRGQTDEWQVVGYQERCDQPSDPGEEQTFWREYLLYNQQRGFAFLVDAQDGWSLVRTVTGVPHAKGASQVEFEGIRYHKRYTYTAKTTYVLGEFYWPVKKGQRTLNMDYAGVGNHASRRLNREQSGNDIVWSAGQAFGAAEVHHAFRIHPKQLAAFQRDVSPVSSLDNRLHGYFWLAVLMVLVVIMAARCSDDCDEVRDLYGEYSNEYRQCREYARSHSGGHGGSYGGFSSGGSHK